MKHRLITVALLLAILSSSAGWTLVGAQSSWQVVPSPSPSAYGNSLTAIAAVSASDAWAVGMQTTFYGTDTLIEHWNGTNWSVVASPNPIAPDQRGYGNFLTGVSALSASDVWAVGSYYSGADFQSKTLAIHWNGAQWNVIPTPNPGTPGGDTFGDSKLLAVTALAPNNIWAVGYFESASTSQPLVVHWNGTKWGVVPSPNPSGSTNTRLNSIAAVSANNIWAVGNYYDSQTSASKTLILKWNGSAWNIVPSPSPSKQFNSLNGVTALSGKDIWVVGTKYVEWSPETLILHWNGRRWKIVPSANPATGYGTSNILQSVVAKSANDIWAVGMFQNENTDYHQHRSLIQHWDGTSWSLVGSPSPGKSSELNGITASSDGALWAVGLFSDNPINIYDGTYTAPKTLVLKQ